MAMIGNSSTAPELSALDTDSVADTKSETLSTRSLGSLPAISTSCMRERNYLYGCINTAKQSGPDELTRFFPYRQLKLFVGTWNMQKGVVPANIDDFLLPNKDDLVQDMYVIGVQEATPDMHSWEVKLQETLGPNHVLVHSVNHGLLHLAVFLRRDLIWFCSNFEDDKVTTRMVSRIKTKGATAVSFQFFGTSFLFICSHFRSGEGSVKERIEDYEKILKNLQLPSTKNNYQNTSSNLKSLFDYTFWFGDLNFRINQPHFCMKQEVEDPSTFDVNEALKCDQLRGNMRRGKVFVGFEEPSISFLPTYKFNPNSDVYDTSKKFRVPSYTDRILHHSNGDGCLNCFHYDSVPSIRTSDHRPVYGLYEVLLKPSFENAALGSGKFDHDVYVQGVRKRVNNFNTTYKSAICNIL